MPRTLSTRDPGFETAFRALLGAKRESAGDVDQAVAVIIEAVAARGDAALVEYTNRFDRVRLTPERLRLSPDEIAAGAALAPAGTLAALRLAAERIASLRRRHARYRRNLSHRGRPGGGGAGLWHGDDRPGRQDRRAGQRLCRRGEAAGLRPGWDRYDRRSLRDPRCRRRAQRPRLDRRRPL